MSNFLEKTLEINMLIDFYRNLLTEKQTTYIEKYYFDDLSLSEIADEFNVSRNAIYDHIKRTVKSLYKYENKLRLVEKYKKRMELIQKIKKNSDTKIKELMTELEALI